MQAFAVDRAAEQVLAALQARGFEHAQVRVSETARCELNLAHNEPSLMRSTAERRVAATGIVDARRASAETGDLGPDGLAALVDALWQAARNAPRDEANAVSAGQHARLEGGPGQADPQALAGALREVMDWRAAHAPSAMIEEALAAHVHERFQVVTSGDSAIAGELGWCEISMMGLAREGTLSSSFNETSGQAHALQGAPARFGIDRMLRDLTRQVHARPLGTRFEGEVILAPGAVRDLLDWLMMQLSDLPLIEGSSLFRERVGQVVASPLLTLQSRFDAPGCVPLSADAFLAPPTVLLDAGRLTQVMPSLYGSRKTGLPHRPVAAQGWQLLPGTSALADMIAAVPRGALVDRLSMGRPGPNGDFAGVVKNSFLIEGGQVGGALSETMIQGNVACMLRDVAAVSAERIDTGSLALPWLRIPGLNFS